jgi:hypothetical protein
MSELRIEMTSHGRGNVWLDGELIQVSAVQFEAAVDRANEATLTLLPHRVTITAPAKIRHPAPPGLPAQSYFEFNAHRARRARLAP